jgi:hypothetical protein
LLLITVAARAAPAPAASDIGAAACERLAGNIGFHHDVRKEGAKRIERSIVCVESGPARSTGRSEAPIPPCTAEEPSVAKEGFFVAGAIVAVESLVPDGALIGKIARPGVRKFLEATSFGAKHEAGTWLGEFAARHFPGQLVANCSEAYIGCPYSWEHLRFRSVTLYVHDRGDPQWYPCPIRGGECTLSKAAWLQVPTARSFEAQESMNEYLRQLPDEDRAMLELRGSVIFPALFVNWSENATRQALLVIEYEAD